MEAEAGWRSFRWEVFGGEVDWFGVVVMVVVFVSAAAAILRVEQSMHGW